MFHTSTFINNFPSYFIATALQCNAFLDGLDLAINNENRIKLLVNRRIKYQAPNFARLCYLYMF